jgi:hypothetical protein
LPDTKITKNVFCAAKQRIKRYSSVILRLHQSSARSEMARPATHLLDEAAHSRPGDSTSAENLYGIPRGFLCCLSGVHFQQGNWSSKVLCLVLVRLYFFSSTRHDDDRTKSGRTMLFIWWVMFSNQLCTDSTRAIMAAILLRTTAWDAKGFPNALR